MSQYLTPDFVDQLAIRASRDNFDMFSDYCWRRDPGHLVPPTDEEYQAYVLSRIEQYVDKKGLDFKEYMEKISKTSFKIDKVRFFRNEISDILGSPYRPRRIHIEAPREHAKTTHVAVKYPLWRWGHDQNLRIFVISKTATLAEAIVGEIKSNIDVNERLQRVFPQLQPSKPWTSSVFRLRRTRIMKTDSAKGIGLFGSITGFRADIIILDDPFDQKETRTEGQRAKIVEFIEKVVFTILEPEGEVIYIGTRWHYDDYWGNLLAKAIEAGGNVFCKIYKSINYVDPEDTASCEYALWPQKWPLEALYQRRSDIGTPNFNCLYQNDPRGLEGIFFKDKWITWYDPAILNTIPDLYLFQGVDPAIGESPESKQTSIFTIALDPRKMDIYMIDNYAEKMDFPTQLKKIYEYSKRDTWPGFLHAKRKLKPLKIGIESNAYQKALSRTAQMEALPVVECHTTLGKPDRMLSLQPHFESGRIKWPNPKLLGFEPTWLEPLKMEFLSFPRGKYTDRLDSLDFAIEVADSSGAGELTAFFG